MIGSGVVYDTSQPVQPSSSPSGHSAGVEDTAALRKSDLIVVVDKHQPDSTVIH